MTESKKPLHLVYYSYHLDPRAGGPTGYLANLRLGLDKISNPDNYSIWFLTENKKVRPKQNDFLTAARNKLLSFDRLNRFYVNHIGRTQRKRIFRRTKYFLNLLNENKINEKLKTFILSHNNVKSIHCHTFIDAAEAHNTLLAIGKRNEIKLILTSHTPEAPSIELSNSYKESGLSEKYIKPFRDVCEKLQGKTFSIVDAIIFPSEESIEPYYQTIANFDQLIDRKKILYLLTGTIGLSDHLTKEEARKQLGIPSDEFIVSFIGRHNSVKGYDLLCEAALNIFKLNLPISFVVAGRENRLFTPPKNSKWKEIGWCNPTVVLRASDLFVLSNRRTYFDLILLEALSLGVNTLATDTGGNKTVFRLTNCINLVKAIPEDIAGEIINQFKNPDKRKNPKIIQDQYNLFFNEIKFAEHYTDLIQKYYDEEGLL